MQLTRERCDLALPSQTDRQTDRHSMNILWDWSSIFTCKVAGCRLRESAPTANLALIDKQANTVVTLKSDKTGDCVVNQIGSSMNVRM